MGGFFYFAAVVSKIVAVLTMSIGSDLRSLGKTPR